MNSVNLIGRLTKDPDLKYGADNQNAYCRLTIAIDRGKDKNGNDLGADFPPIVCFGKVAENCEKFLSKGRQVGVQGRIRTGKYEKNGQTIYTTEIYADKVEFLGSKGDTPSENTQNKNTKPDNTDVMSGFSQLDDGDLPF